MSFDINARLAEIREECIQAQAQWEQRQHEIRVKDEKKEVHLKVKLREQLSAEKFAELSQYITCRTVSDRVGMCENQLAHPEMSPSEIVQLWDYSAGNDDDAESDFWLAHCRDGNDHANSVMAF